MKQLYVLIACEESQAECQAFRSLGHVAFSCDIQPCRKGANPDWHIHSDVTPLLQGQTTFTTQSGHLIKVPRWDLIIAHPPCTYLCMCSAVRMYVKGNIQWPRYKQMILARQFFFQCLNAHAQYVAVENPIPLRIANLPKPSCYASPHWYGAKYTKKTCYWLKNLPPLMPTIINPKTKCYVKNSRGKDRSRTLPQLASAIANQWGAFIVADLDHATSDHAALDHNR